MHDSKLPMKTYMASLYQAQAYRNLNSFFNNLLKIHDLKQSEWTFLGILYDAKKTNLTTMAEIMNVRQPMVSRLSRQLVEKGYVRIIKYEKDSRIRYLEMPDMAKRKVENIETELRIALKPSLKKISRKELTCYTGVLIKLSKKM